jgi:hypothetical protein
MKKNRFNWLAAGLCLAGLFTVTSSANAQVTVAFDGVSPVEIVNVQATGAFNIGPAGVFSGIYNLTVDGSPTPSFCIDLFRDAPPTPLTDYSFTDLSLSPIAPDGPMGAASAVNIEKLWAAYFPEATTSNQDAAALQVAIWEVVAQGVGTYTLTFSNNDPVTTEVANMLASLPNLTAVANLTALTSPDGQNYVVAAPEPMTGSCFLFGLGVLACLQRLKIGRRI